MKKIVILLLFVLASSLLFAQDDLLSLLGDEEDSTKTEYATASFKTTRVINSQSLENVSEGVLDVKIQHRFGFVNSGAAELFGLDQSTVRLGLDYGITSRLMVGIGRSSFQKEVDGFVKYKFFRQSTGFKTMPVTLSYYGSIMINTLPWQDPDRENLFSSRVYYSNMILVGRKLNESTTIQLMPTQVHRNLVETIADENDIFALGIAGRQKLSKRVAINAEYFYLLPNQIKDQFHNSFSIGFDIETGGHVFQLHLSNSTGMNEKTYIGETVGDWLDGDIHFGFNIARVFTIKAERKRE